MIDIRPSAPGFPLQDELEKLLRTSKRPLIVILGQTASGKTAYSLDVASHIVNLRGKKQHPWRGAEIINADSRQFYRLLDIGTAKILPHEMRGIPHHLIDALDPKEEVSIAWFKEKAEECIDAVLACKSVPILVGGSMLYISAVIDGLQPLPAVSPELRKRLEDAYEKDQGEDLYRQLQDVDPEAAIGIDRRNKVYLIRALELALISGQQLSSIRRKKMCPYDLLLLGLRWDTAQLKLRIHERLVAMWNGGWKEEVQSLLNQGYGPKDPGFKSHGYCEIAEFLRNGGDETELLEKIERKTRQFAKRQMTWWRHDPRIHWITF